PHTPALPASLFDQPTSCELVRPVRLRVSHQARMRFLERLVRRSVNHRVFEKTARVTLHRRIRQLALPDLAYGVENLSRRDIRTRRLQHRMTPQIRVIDYRTPALG